jgi:hypothetical protein
MGFWLLVPGRLMGGGVGEGASVVTGPLIARSVMPVLTMPGSQQPNLR